MGIHAVDTVTPEDKRRMRELLTSLEDGATVDDIVEREDTPFENKQHVVSVLHALLNEGKVSHNVSREYYLTA